MKEIFFLEPVFKEMIWGGSRLGDEFGYDIPSKRTGECWMVSAHETGDCRILNGRFQGKTLSQLWREEKKLFGNLSFERFPLIVKIIDAKEDLSIQVHPDDSYAKKHENGSIGKTECWYILDCKEETGIIIGHNAKTKKELNEMMDEERWEDFIRKEPIKKGDFFQINSGTVHGIKKGTLLLEIQQNSDITYRIYDYDRLQEGKPRELHIDKSKEVISIPYKKVENEKKVSTVLPGELLISCPHYNVVRFKNKGKHIISQEYSFLVVNVIDGNGTMDSTSLKKGDSFILPFGYGESLWEGDMELVFSYIS